MNNNNNKNKEVDIDEVNRILASFPIVFPDLLGGPMAELSEENLEFFKKRCQQIYDFYIAGREEKFSCQKCQRQGISSYKMYIKSKDYFVPEDSGYDFARRFTPAHWERKFFPHIVLYCEECAEEMEKKEIKIN